MASPHSSDNSHSKLYETMLTEYALDAAWHDKSICEKIVKSAGILSPAHACGTLIARVDKKAIIKIKDFS